MEEVSGGGGRDGCNALQPQIVSSFAFRLVPMAAQCLADNALFCPTLPYSALLDRYGYRREEREPILVEREL